MNYPGSLTRKDMQEYRTEIYYLTLHGFKNARSVGWIIREQPFHIEKSIS
jgi:hypothetical protein